jgi:hypothetical protein
METVHAGNGNAATIATTGLVGLLLQTLMSERTSFANGDSPEMASMKELTSRSPARRWPNMPTDRGAGVRRHRQGNRHRQLSPIVNQRPRPSVAVPSEQRLSKLERFGGNPDLAKVILTRLIVSFIRPFGS